jgi:imidazole glycerol-phosphate synthase subunit HisH
LIAIINYGLGNINAFSNVYRKLNIDCIIADNKRSLINATKLILPGVGSFDQAMKLLAKSGMRDTIDSMVLKNDVPIIGICVGMQILGKSSEEGKEKGLGYINARVKKISSKNSKLILPQMGWNNVLIKRQSNLLNRISENNKFYFLHSYYMSCLDMEVTLGSSNYFGEFTSIINFKNIYGVQFHPEKSHDDGTQLLKNFAEL